MNKGCFSVEVASREGGKEAKRASGGSVSRAHTFTQRLFYRCP